MNDVNVGVLNSYNLFLSIFDIFTFFLSVFAKKTDSGESTGNNYRMVPVVRLFGVLFIVSH